MKLHLQATQQYYLRKSKKKNLRQNTTTTTKTIYLKKNKLSGVAHRQSNIAPATTTLKKPWKSPQKPLIKKTVQNVLSHSQANSTVPVTLSAKPNMVLRPNGLIFLEIRIQQKW